jgi:protein-S-isoprenylcysteine O-methyltransferase Ste14
MEQSSPTGHQTKGMNGMDAPCQPKEWICRATGIAFGFSTQVLFLFTVWYLFWFLRDGSIGARHGNWILCDSALAVFFAVSHSVMLVPQTRRYLSRWIPSPFYDSVFCVVTCLSLLLLFFAWRSSETALWEMTPWAASVTRVAFYACWGALFYSLSLTGLGYQNGWTPFYYWLRRQSPPRRQFKPRGAYKLIRHPVYMSFLGLVWLTPRMTMDHAALTAIWTAYIFYGSFLKDRRLEYFVGETYKRYETQVAGFPLVPFGPLARHKLDSGHRDSVQTLADAKIEPTGHGSKAA